MATWPKILFTAMHEVIGHGSGKLGPKVTKEPASYIKEYYSTLEESRADLMALWNFWDPKLIEMGVMPNDDVARAATTGKRAPRSSSFTKCPPATRSKKITGAARS